MQEWAIIAIGFKMIAPQGIMTSASHSPLVMQSYDNWKTKSIEPRNFLEIQKVKPIMYVKNGFLSIRNLIFESLWNCINAERRK